MNWTRDLPAEPGYFWLTEDHWTDGHPEIVRVFRAFDHWAMIRPGKDEAERLPHPSYWMKVELPERPVFGKAT